MAVCKCKMCGADLHVTQADQVAECEYCGTVQTVPKADDEKKMTLFNRANKLRLNNEFDKAAGIYESLVADFPDEAEAYWGIVLCKYGIEYVTDPATGKKIPTCHRSSFDSVMEDDAFEQACENADALARRMYREEAKKIEDLRRGILEVSNKEEPYDIFICYKETDENGSRTVDSAIAQDVYSALTEKGYRVFFSRISLEDKLGQEYEPYIFAALNSARIMLAFGTKYEYYNAVWVKNEWSRFLQLMAAGKKKTLIPCYKDIDAYDMPKEFARLQSQDMGKVGALQDLLRGIGKILPKTAPVQAAPMRPIAAGPAAATVESLLKRMFLYLEDGSYEEAVNYSNRILDVDPENGEAYLGQLMAEKKVRARADLKKLTEPIEESPNYTKAVRFGSDALRAELEDCRAEVRRNIQTKNKTDRYNAALAALRSARVVADFTEAAKQFEALGEFGDAAQKAQEARQKGEEAAERARAAALKQKEEVYAHALELSGNRSIETRLEVIRQLAEIADFRDAKERAQALQRETLQAAQAQLNGVTNEINMRRDAKTAIDQAEMNYQARRSNLELAWQQKIKDRENMEGYCKRFWMPGSMPIVDRIRTYFKTEFKWDVLASVVFFVFIIVCAGIGSETKETNPALSNTMFGLFTFGFFAIPIAYLILKRFLRKKKIQKLLEEEHKAQRMLYAFDDSMAAQRQQKKQLDEEWKNLSLEESRWKSLIDKLKKAI